MRKYRITGRRYNETPRYYDWDINKISPVYDMVEEKTWDIEARSLQDAKIWFYGNYPEYVQGGCVVRTDIDDKTGPEFCMFGIPSPEYGCGNYETVANRVKYVQWDLNNLIERGI